MPPLPTSWWGRLRLTLHRWGRLPLEEAAEHETALEQQRVERADLEQRTRETRFRMRAIEEQLRVLKRERLV